MHFHGYLWAGDKAVFDKESIRRPPSPVEPVGSSAPDLVERYRQAVAEWQVTGVPPLETAYWLVKPAKLIRGTWGHPKEAAEWLGERLAEYAPHFALPIGPERIADKVAYAAKTLGWGGDVSLGSYLRRPKFLSLALVTCSPNHAAPEQLCPAGEPASASGADSELSPSSVVCTVRGSC